MARSEAGGAAQHDAGGHAFAAVEREELFGEEVTVGALALPEVGGQFQTVLVHSRAPSQTPAAAVAKPSVTETTMLAAAYLTWRSSPRRCVSSIHVENVV